MSEALRQDLEALAGDVELVDLYDRTLATARRSRRQRMAAVGAAAATVLTIAVTSVVVWPRTGPPPPPIQPSPVVTSASVSPSPSPTAARPTQLTLADLRDATIEVPPLAGCGGRMTFTEGRAGTPDGADVPTAIANIIFAAPVDAYGTGLPITVATMNCTNGQGWAYQAFTVERRNDGTIVGRDVIASLADDAPFVILDRVRAAAAGSVDVEFGFPDQFPAQLTRQWRTFTWQAGRFTQTGGPTSFADHPLIARLRVTSTPLVLTREATSGYDLGSTKITVTNLGTGPIERTVIRVTTDNNLAMFNATVGQPDPTRPGVVTWPYQAGGIAPGDSLEVTIPWLIMYPTDPPPAKIMCTIIVKALTADGQQLVELGEQTPVEVPVSHA